MRVICRAQPLWGVHLYWASVPVSGSPRGQSAQMLHRLQLPVLMDLITIPEGVTPRMLQRANFIMEAVKKAKVISNVVQLRKVGLHSVLACSFWKLSDFIVLRLFSGYHWAREGWMGSCYGQKVPWSLAESHDSSWTNWWDQARDISQDWCRHQDQNGQSLELVFIFNSAWKIFATTPYYVL